MNLKHAAVMGKQLVVNNLPTILTGLGIVGVGATAFFAGQGALKAERYLNENVETPKGCELSFKEKAKLTYRFYIPAALTGAATIGCIIGANRVSVAQLATMTTVATATEKALVDHRNTIEEVFGEKGLKKVDEKLNQQAVARYFGTVGDVYETGHGSVLCCEGQFTGIKFRANPEWVHKCVNDYNAELNAGHPQSMNDFLMLLIPNIDTATLPTDLDVKGFNLEINGRLMELEEDSGLLETTHEPYLIFRQRNYPLTNYMDFL